MTVMTNEVLRSKLQYLSECGFSIRKLAVNAGISQQFLSAFVLGSRDMREAKRLKVQAEINRIIEGLTGSTAPTPSITEIAIAEFPELEGLSDHDITVKIFNKCIRKQADKYKYRELLEQFGYDKRISF